jgi:hypothetical protein
MELELARGAGREEVECHCEGGFRMNALIFEHEYLSCLRLCNCNFPSRATPESAVDYHISEQTVA